MGNHYEYWNCDECGRRLQFCECRNTKGPEMTTDNPDPLEVFVWDTERLDQVFTAASMKHGYYESLIAVAAEGARIKHAPVIADLEALVGELGEALRKLVVACDEEIEPAFCEPPYRNAIIDARASIAKLEKARGKDQTDG